VIAEVAVVEIAEILALDEEADQRLIGVSRLDLVRRQRQQLGRTAVDGMQAAIGIDQQDADLQGIQRPGLIFAAAAVFLPRQGERLSNPPRLLAGEEIAAALQLELPHPDKAEPVADQQHQDHAEDGFPGELNPEDAHHDRAKRQIGGIEEKAKVLVFSPVGGPASQER
jgi:hypothetical protein